MQSAVGFHVHLRSNPFRIDASKLGGYTDIDGLFADFVG
jgi:hypothetical protein